MIPASAVKKFLNRKLRDFRTYKKLSNAKLQARCDKLPVVPPIWKKLSRTQKICFIIGAEEKRFFFAKDMGMGKTLLSLALIRYFMKLHHNERVLVLVPYRSNKGEWVREIKKHTKLKACVLRGSSEGKWAKLETTKAPIVIETFGGLVQMTCDKKPSKKKEGKNQLVPNATKVRRLLKKIDGCIMDEGNKASNKHALSWRICRQISKKASIFFQVAGTPFGRDPTPLWGEMFLVDRGAALGTTLGLFRAAFFKEVQNKWGVEYKFDTTKKSLLNRTLANGLIRFKAKDSDLPGVIPIEKRVPYPEDEIGTYYEQAMQALKDAKGNFREMKNAFLRLRQISSGFLGYADDELGIRAEIEFQKNPKLESLLDTASLLEPSNKFLVFHDFVFSGSIISRELEKKGIKHIRLYHKTKDADIPKLLEQFNEDEETQGFILNTSGAYGLNLQRAQYGFFYERPVPLVFYKQMTRRLHRQYSMHKHIFLYDFIMEETMDDRIKAFHASGQRIFNGIMDGTKEEQLLKQLEATS